MVQRLDLSNMSIKVESPAVYTKDGVKISVESIAQVRRDRRRR